MRRPPTARRWPPPSPWPSAQAAPRGEQRCLPGRSAWSPTSHSPPTTTASTRTPRRARRFNALAVGNLAVAGCGAGGSAALYVLAMQPRLTGDVALIEPGWHKLSNLNRYLMTTAADVHAAVGRLGGAPPRATFAPALRPTVFALPWGAARRAPLGPGPRSVDTVEARWSIQARSATGTTILDGAVMGLLDSIMRVVPGGWCLECKHPYDPDLAVKQRAARWGQSVETILRLDGHRAARHPEHDHRAGADPEPASPVDFASLEGVPFDDTPRMTECGATPTRTDVPSRAPVLPVATTPVGVLLAAEIAKHYAARDAALTNWLAHDLARSPNVPRISGVRRPSHARGTSESRRAAGPAERPT